MSIDVEKPEPMNLAGRYYYTLTSYDPVSIEVEVPSVTEADVNMILRSMVEDEGAKLEEVDGAWLAEHFDGINSIDEIKQRLHTQLEQMNASYAENSKPSLVVNELAKRLKQAIPADELNIYKSVFAQQFDMDLAQDKLTREDFLARTGSTPDMIEAMFTDQARSMAEQIAALDAYIDEKKLTVADEEIEGLLGVPPEQASEIVAQARQDNALDEIRRVALRNKATNILVAECSCVYKHESPEDAAKRIEAFERMTEQAKKLEDED